MSLEDATNAEDDDVVEGWGGMFKARIFHHTYLELSDLIELENHISLIKINRLCTPRYRGYSMRNKEE